MSIYNIFIYVKLSAIDKLRKCYIYELIRVGQIILKLYTSDGCCFTATISIPSVSTGLKHIKKL